MDYKPVHVEGYSGHKANERPVAFTFQGRRRDVSEQDISDRLNRGLCLFICAATDDVITGL